MVERALVVEQARGAASPTCVPGPVLVPAEPGHDAVGRALVLDLEHRPLARLVRRVEALGDDAVEPGALEPVEPVGGGRPVAGRRASGGSAAPPRRAPPRAGPVARPGARRAGPRRRAPAGPRRRTTPATASASIATREAAGWMRSSSASNSQPAVAGDDDLAVEDAALGQGGPQRVGQLREVAVERLEVARLGEDLVAVAEHEGAEAVPLGLVQPAVAVGQARRTALASIGSSGGWNGRSEGHGPPSVRRHGQRAPAPPAPAPARGSRRPGPVERRIARELAAGEPASSRADDGRPRPSGRRGSASTSTGHGVVGQDAQVVDVEARRGRRAGRGSDR